MVEIDSKEGTKNGEKIGTMFEFSKFGTVSNDNKL